MNPHTQYRATRDQLLAEQAELNRQYKSAETAPQIAAICEREAEIELILTEPQK